MTPESRLVFLTGMPGAGKSYWGRIWAVESGWHFTDLDLEIEASSGQSIEQIFAINGEAFFREQERDLLQQIIEAAKPRTIIACGGGTPVFHDNLDKMKRTGSVVYLKTTISVLVKRLLASGISRPLLSDHDLYTRLQQLLSVRRSFYEQADIILEGEALSASTFAKIMEPCIKPH